MNTMRILMLSQFYPPVIGGEERHVRSLAAGLAQRGHEVHVVTQAHAGCPAHESELGVQVHRLSGTLQRSAALFSEPERRHMPPFPDPEFALALMRLMRQVRPQVLHAHNWIVHSCAPLKRWSGAPLVQTLHDYGLRCPKKNLMHAGQPCDGPALSRCLGCAAEHYGALKGTVTMLANRAMTALSPVDRYLCVSGAVATLNRLDTQPVPWEVVPNFIPDDLGRNTATLDAPLDDPRLQELPDQPYLLFVGDLRRQKGLHDVLAAWERLPQRPSGRPPLVLIGRRCPDTPEQLPPGVRVLTSWPHAAVMQAWRGALLGLAPSIWPEPCATVVLEAMACGKPVIASAMGGNPDMVAHERTGLLVPAADPAALAGAMQRLIDDAPLRERMGRAALERVDQFRAGTVVPHIEAVYRQLIDSQQPRRQPAPLPQR